MKLLFKYLFLFLVGAVTYYFIEIMWDGSSHWTMAVLGGICFVLIGEINEYISWNMPLVLQGIIGATIVTALEFVFGCVLNLILQLNIWNYSRLPFNICGQICLLFTIIWFVLSIVAIIIDDCLRYWIFKEEKPHYKLF